MLMYLIFTPIFVAAMVSLFAKVFWMKSSTGVAKMINETAVTSNTPVLTSVCFSNLMTGFT